MDVNLRAAASDVLAGCAHVIFNVAAAQHAARIDVFESGKHFFRRTPGHLHNHIQAAAMAHPHYEFRQTLLAGAFKDFINQRNERGNALQRKTLVAQIALLQHLLEEFGSNQQVERPLLVHRRLRRFQALLNPAATRRIGDVHELHSNRSAIHATGLLGELAFGRQIRVRHGPQKAKRIKVGFEISPTSECIEHTLALSVGRFQYCG